MATTAEEHYEWIEGLFEAIEKDLRTSLEQLNGVEVEIPLKNPLNLRRLFIGPNAAKYLYVTSGKHFYRHALEDRGEKLENLSDQEWNKKIGICGIGRGVFGLTFGQLDNCYCCSKNMACENIKKAYSECRNELPCVYFGQEKCDSDYCEERSKCQAFYKIFKPDFDRISSRG